MGNPLLEKRLRKQMNREIFIFENTCVGDAVARVCETSNSWIALIGFQRCVTQLVYALRTGHKRYL